MTDQRVASRGNAARQVGALTMQRVGDLVVDAKTVLAWLLATLGAPTGMTGLLVPIRESGSMLPQTALMPWIKRLRHRRWVWVVGGAVQALAAAAMALTAATLDGAAAGTAILVSLAVFALGRSASSIASKDVLGRTIEQGRRGRVNGAATVAGGVVAITIGLLMRSLGGEDTPASVFAWLLLGAAGAWIIASALYASIDEPAGDHEEVSLRDASGSALRLLRDDAVFRRFMFARTLLLVSALSPPFVVVLATQAGDGGLAGLGPFVISSGVASLVGGWVWGAAADRSSRLVMVAAAASSSTVVLTLLAVLRIDALRDAALLYPAAYLLLALAHTGTRLGRKTYVVDIAEGNQRTEYVAVSNTAMGVLLLITGAISAGVATFGAEGALLLLAALGLLGVVVSLRLPEAHER